MTGFLFPATLALFAGLLIWDTYRALRLDSWKRGQRR